MELTVLQSVSVLILCVVVIVLIGILSRKKSCYNIVYKNEPVKNNKIIQIVNPVNYHYEVLEEIIHQVPRIIKRSLCENYNIHLYIMKNSSFETHIRRTYPGIHIYYDVEGTFILSKNHYTIFATTKNVNLQKNHPRIFYVMHAYKKKYSTWKNIYGFASSFSTSQRLSVTHLPFVNAEKKITTIPTFAVQGNLNHRDRRNWKLLADILRKKWTHPFKLKLIGRGSIPDVLKPYKDSIILRNKLNYVDYHKEFLDVYCLIVPNTPKSTPQYFGLKLTSSISYIQSYKIRGLVHEKLHQEFPNLKNITTFTSEENFRVAFEEVLNSFYHDRDTDPNTYTEENTTHYGQQEK